MQNVRESSSVLTNQRSVRESLSQLPIGCFLGTERRRTLLLIVRYWYVNR